MAKGILIMIQLLISTEEMEQALVLALWVKVMISHSIGTNTPMKEKLMTNDLADAQRIFEQWHECAKNGNVEALMNLYAPDAILETPLTMAILDDAKSGILRGPEIRRFFEEGVRRRPNELVQWYRDGSFFWNGHRLVWEYPRQTPHGDQVDILEIMDIAEGKIIHHRIYWGWFGFELLKQSFIKKAGKHSLQE